MPAISIDPFTALPHHRWEISVLSQVQDEAVDPAAEQNYSPLSTDDQIKANEIAQAARARQLTLAQNDSMITHPQDAGVNHAEETYNSSISLDDQIKAYEAAQAALAERQQRFLRQHQLLQQQQRVMLRHTRQSVHFAEEALLYSSDRTVEEVKRMWYSRGELNVFKNERKHIVKILKTTNFDLVAIEQSGLYCLRGYEPYFSLEVNKAMKYSRTLVISLVLGEQDRQRALGYRDDDAMYRSCCGASQWARDNAVQLGLNDEFDVYSEYENFSNEENSDNSYCDECYSNSHVIDISDDFEAPTSTSEDIILLSSSLGKRKDSMEQLECNYRQEILETESNDDNLAERLDSALKLVEALRFGKPPPSLS